MRSSKYTSQSVLFNITSFSPVPINERHNSSLPHFQTHRMMAKCNLYDLSEESGQDYPPVPQKYRYFSNAVSFLSQSKFV